MHLLAALVDHELLGQAAHTLAPVLLEKEPAEQEVQTDAELPAYVPAPHSPHAALVSMPVPVLNVPAKQPVHVATLWALQPPYVPAEHGVGQARMIMGEYVSPWNAYRAEISVLVRAFV